MFYFLYFYFHQSEYFPQECQTVFNILDGNCPIFQPSFNNPKPYFPSLDTALSLLCNIYASPLIFIISC